MFVRRVLLIITTLAAIISCKFSRHDAGEKFATFTQTIDARIHEENILIRKVHYPQWRICYEIECPNSNIAAKKYEDAITKALQTWLQPLAELNRKKLIGSDPDDFSYYLNTTDKTCYYEALNSKDKYQLYVMFIDLRAMGKRGTYTQKTVHTPCLSDSDAHEILLHETGHAFGLADTYPIRDDITFGFQPPSVMSGFDKSDGKNALADDDIKGVQWLYRYYQRDKLKKGITPVGLKECPFPDYEYVEAQDGGACRPRYIFMHNLKQAHHFEKTHSNLHYAHIVLDNLTLSSFVGASKGGVSDLDVNDQDDTGNAGLHYMVLFGAYSLWNDHPKPNDLTYGTVPIWTETLAKFLKDQSCRPNHQTNCIDVNMQNNNGDTALHHAARTGYVQAARLLLAHKRLDAKIKNKQGKTACDLLKQNLQGLQEAGLEDLKVAEKIHAIQGARSKIFNLLDAHNACS